MRIHLIFALLVFSAAAQASSTLRVGSHVLTAGDSSVRVTELLGKPSSKTRPKATHGSHRGRGGVRVVNNAERGERWLYRRGDHVTTITIVDGKVLAIDDRRR